MRAVKSLLIGLVILSAIPTFAQQGASSPQPKEIVGKVQSFSGNILAVKPPNGPAVWVALPPDFHVDRGALKEGVNVTVNAYWDAVCYMATEVTVQK